MTDWNSLGLKCGLEIHQQLEGKKLFCHCPTKIRDDDPHFTFKRRLRAVAGETGKLDVAALHEMQKGKSFIYEGFNDTNCLVEMDEEPPHKMNPEALETGLQVSILLDAKITNQLQVMRKTVVDGSNTSGFQRTALIGYDGKMETSEGEVSIQNISIEEDSCRRMKTTDKETHYRLDRLGIPLIEIGTGSEIRTPEEAQEVAEKLGLLLRSTGQAKRGLGTIRQDVNVSIKEGARVEIKGAQDLKMIPELIENEVKRQQVLAEIMRELQERGVEKVQSDIQDLGHVLAKSESTILSKNREKGGVVLGIRLKGFKGILGRETQPGKRFGTELSDAAKSKAGVGGLFHSDELPKYGITESETEAVAKALGCEENDAFVLIADKKEKVRYALESVLSRARQALEGIPREVRKANPDGTTTFLRPMPGAARMYPETDVPSIPLTKERLEQVELPESIADKAERYEKMGLGDDLAAKIARSEDAELFEKIVEDNKDVKPAFIAETLIGAVKTIRRQDGIDISPTEQDYRNLFAALQEEEISKDSVLDILKEGRPVEDVIGDYSLMSEEELRERLEKIISDNPDAPFGALMGQAMGELKGKASGKKISELLRELSQEND